MDKLSPNPVTASSLNQTWLRLTGKEAWRPVEARVYSCDWTDLPDQIDSAIGHYHVVYTYHVEGEIYTGRFADYGMQDEEYLKRNDVFEVKYNSRNPARSYYPELRTRTNFMLICFAIGAVAGAAVLTISYFTGHLHS